MSHNLDEDMDLHLATSSAPSSPTGRKTRHSSPGMLGQEMRRTLSDIAETAIPRCAHCCVRELNRHRYIWQSDTACTQSRSVILSL